MELVTRTVEIPRKESLWKVLHRIARHNLKGRVAHIDAAFGKYFLTITMLKELK